MHPRPSRRRTTGRPKNFGFTTFETEQGLLNALAHGVSHDIEGIAVAVNRAEARPRRGEAAPGGEPYTDADTRTDAGGYDGAACGQPKQPHGHHRHGEVGGSTLGGGGGGGYPEEKGRGQGGGLPGSHNPSRSFCFLQLDSPPSFGDVISPTNTQQTCTASVDHYKLLCPPRMIKIDAECSKTFLTTCSEVFKKTFDLLESVRLERGLCARYGMSDYPALGPRLYVGGIDHRAHTLGTVRAHFTQFGEVVDVYFPKDRATGRGKTFCFVTFAAATAAEKALAHAKKDLEVAGRVITHTAPSLIKRPFHPLSQLRLDSTQPVFRPRFERLTGLKCAAKNVRVRAHVYVYLPVMKKRVLY